MDSHSLKDFILDFYKAWEERDAIRVANFYDKGVQAHVDFQPVTLEDMLNRLEFSREKFLKAEYGLKDLFIDEAEGKIAVRMEQRYVLRSGEDDISCKSITLYKVVNKKITEIWMSFFPNVNYLDNT